MRLDVYMVSAGLAESREKARKLILAGAVFVDGRVAEKASKEIIGEMTVMLTRKERFVGRGGEKLAAALALFKIDPTGLRALDIGASTGGFTDCLLQSGASFVVALDAGKGQLHPRLCADARVRSVEKYNARNLSPADVGTFDLVVMDVSFISQALILPRLSALLLPGGRVVSLIKPQFELNKNALGKNGIVRDEKNLYAAVSRVLSCAAATGLACHALTPSPILGGDGNREFLALFCPGTGREFTPDELTGVINGKAVIV